MIQKSLSQAFFAWEDHPSLRVAVAANEEEARLYSSKEKGFWEVPEDSNWWPSKLNKKLAEARRLLEDKNTFC